MANNVPKLRKLITIVALNFIAVILLFALCEGLASLVLFGQKISSTRAVAERAHTRYDAELGWVNLPNVTLEDFYGPGLDLQTNAQGFRSAEDFSVAVPPGKLRVICSGDSFTLGYGVANDQTWCQMLTDLDARLQPVNMGQGGYGVDQAYLWYKRDGIKLDHDLHLFAFITTDFERMEQTEFFGYGKPLLTLGSDGLEVANVPVPERSFYWPWLTQNGDAIQGLRSVQMFGRYVTGGEAPATAESMNARVLPPEYVAAAILRDLLRLNADRDSTLVLVYLPTLGDYDRSVGSNTERWREFLNVAAAETGVILVDLVEEFRKLPDGEGQTLFIPEGMLDFPGAAGHYSVAGNRYVAKLLYEQLLAQPPVANRLAEIEP